MGKGDGSRQQLSSGSVGTHDVSLVELALVVVDESGREARFGGTRMLDQ